MEIMPTRQCAQQVSLNKFFKTNCATFIICRCISIQALAPMFFSTYNLFSIHCSTYFLSTWLHSVSWELIDLDRCGASRDFSHPLLQCKQLLVRRILLWNCNSIILTWTKKVIKARSQDTTGIMAKPCINFQIYSSPSSSPLSFTSVVSSVQPSPARQKFVCSVQPSRAAIMLRQFHCQPVLFFQLGGQSTGQSLLLLEVHLSGHLLILPLHLLTGALSSRPHAHRPFAPTFPPMISPVLFSIVVVHPLFSLCIPQHFRFLSLASIPTAFSSFCSIPPVPFHVSCFPVSHPSTFSFSIFFSFSFFSVPAQSPCISHSVPLAPHSSFGFRTVRSSL
mmetsp:Transcript_25915/g.35770  ORF Transcript_25915/g.35770 Transcript_25915/m.35770 type:complete len:335 (-) Transcript_25915:296-1300(-)